MKAKTETANIARSVKINSNATPRRSVWFRRFIVKVPRNATVDFRVKLESRLYVLRFACPAPRDFLFYRFDGDGAPSVSENFQKIKRADAEKTRLVGAKVTSSLL
jgi:hypothetical protein